MQIDEQRRTPPFVQCGKLLRKARMIRFVYLLNAVRKISFFMPPLPLLRRARHRPGRGLAGA